MPRSQLLPVRTPHPLPVRTPHPLPVRTPHPLPVRTPHPPPFVCSSTNGALDAAWVHVSGELDLVTAPQLERTLRERQRHARVVVLDLRELDFMDGRGMRAIVDASLHARGTGDRLLLLRGPPHVDRIFALTGCSGQVTIGDVEPVVPYAA